MALTPIIIVCILAGVNAGYVWVDSGAASYTNSPFPGFGVPQPMFGPNFPFDYVFSRVPFPRIPTVEEMRNVKPGPNQVYNGVAVRSSSSMVRDKDGKLVPTGGTSILVNQNGQVHEQSMGQNPPNINDPIIIPMLPTMPPMPPMPTMPTMPPMPPMPPMSPMPTMPPMPAMPPMPTMPPMPKMPPMPPMPKMPAMPSIPSQGSSISSINLKNYVPGENEQFVGVSTSSYSSSSNKNGVKKEAGGTDTLVNVNGVVDEKGLEYMKNDIPN